jgi:hypothetical protein
MRISAITPSVRFAAHISRDVPLLAVAQACRSTPRPIGFLDASATRPPPIVQVSVPVAALAGDVEALRHHPSLIFARAQSP